VARAASFRLSAYDSIGSTSTEAMQAARQGDGGRHWFFTTEQTSGRGRRGRTWIAPRGNMAASVLLLTRQPPVVAASLGFVAGLALTDALTPLLPVHEAGRLKLKWPNDVLMDGAKLAGILLEAEPHPNGSLAVVVGIGVNVVAAPTDLPYPATSLAQQGIRLNAEALVERLADAFAPLLDLWNEGRGLPPLLEIWRDRAAGMGQTITVTLGSQVIEGIFETIDASGCLVIRDAAGARRNIAAGDVHLGSSQAR
jgi:BirA family biotin operon repressor/biotin-[acetyl-CoA-carboxylase] ligase